MRKNFAVIELESFNCKVCTRYFFITNCLVRCCNREKSTSEEVTRTASSPLSTVFQEEKHTCNSYLNHYSAVAECFLGVILHVININVFDLQNSHPRSWNMTAASESLHALWHEPFCMWTKIIFGIKTNYRPQTLLCTPTHRLRHWNRAHFSSRLNCTDRHFVYSS